MLRDENIIQALNALLNQSAKIRKQTDAVYFCPMCKHHKRKLEISIKSGKYNCWVCGFRGTSFNTLIRRLNGNSRFYKLLNVSNTSIPNDDALVNIFKITEDNTYLRLPDNFISLSAKSDSYDSNRAINYLIGRNITYIDIIRYNIGYCEDGPFRGRIIIPSYDADYKLNFFSGRAYFDTKFKYKLCESSKDIIGFESFINFDLPVTLVEGQFDAIAVRHNAIPLFGKTMSQKLRTKLLQTKVPSVNVLLDSDARDSALTICKFFVNNGIPCKLILIEGKDPSEIGFHKTWEYINASQFVDYEFIISSKLKNKR